jgi:hypothetical protein
MNVNTTILMLYLHLRQLFVPNQENSADETKTRLTSD